MEHDLTKLSPLYKQMYEEFISSEFTPNVVPDELYQFYLSNS